MIYKLGSGYIGSSSIQTSVANQEIIPNSPSTWSTKYSLYKFSLDNYSDCTVTINGGNNIFIPANKGFNIDETDAPIYSFKIVESGILFNFIAAY